MKDAFIFIGIFLLKESPASVSGEVIFNIHVTDVPTQGRDLKNIHFTQHLHCAGMHVYTNANKAVPHRFCTITLVFQLRPSLWHI